MNNFGVIEVASTKTTNAPGWAYVPDTAPPTSLTTSTTTTLANRNKRAARNQTGLSYADLTARQATKIRKELETLDRDAPSVAIPIPTPTPSTSVVRRTAGAGGGGKHTSNVRRILQSQKTFANHLDDFVALNEGGGSSSTPAASGGNTSSSRSAAAAASAAISSRRASAPQRRNETPARSGQQKQASVKQEDTAMPDAPPATESSTAAGGGNSTLLAPYAKPPPAAQPSDNNPLLVSRVPPMPSDEELRALMAAPPLSYLEARAGWNEEDKKYPVRVFCDVCGYWGRVKCMKCGVRVCALDCLETHKEECVTRYGL